MGATAGGKTDIALSLARRIKGEIISVDSRQTFKLLQAGTAKPEGKWLGGSYAAEGINYHLVDIIDADQTYSAAAFAAQAKKTQKEINSRNSAAIFAGGTGLYIHSFFIGLDELPPADKKIRAELTDSIKKDGNLAMHKKLQKIDPLSAKKIPPQNTQRLIRAMEIYQLTGKPISSFHTKNTANLPSDKALFVLLNWDKQLLHKRIEQRTQNIFNPMVEETKKLLALGYKSDCPALKSLGYKEILDFISGKITKPQAIEKIIKLTKAYAKRQVTWFKRYKNILSIDIENKAQWQIEKITEQIINEWKK